MLDSCSRFIFFLFIALNRTIAWATIFRFGGVLIFADRWGFLLSWHSRITRAGSYCNLIVVGHIAITFCSIEINLVISVAPYCNRINLISLTELFKLLLVLIYIY